MKSPDFSHVTTWVFDLDNTLYSPQVRLFDQIERRMTHWVMRSLGLEEAPADLLRNQYYRHYGTTLAGLMAEHQIDPVDYLNDVHNIDFSGLTPDRALAARIAELPGRRIIFTNADTLYACKVLERRGLSGLFDAIYGVEDTGYLPKPGREAFEKIIAADRLAPERAAMFEDDPRNLVEPHQMGMRTVHVAPEALEPQPYIHHHTADLTHFLDRLMRG